MSEGETDARPDLTEAYQREHRAVYAFLISLLAHEQTEDPKAHHAKYSALIEAHDHVVAALTWDDED